MGRRNIAPEPEGKPKHESQDERDARLESRYTFDRSDYATVLAYVSANKWDLADEFLTWKSGLTFGAPWRDDLRQFERWRFAHELDAAPHGILAFTVAFKLFPDDPKFATLRRAKLTPPGAVPKTPERAARAHEMPATHGTRKEIDARLIELQRQADAIRPPAMTFDPAAHADSVHDAIKALDRKAVPDQPRSDG